MFEVGSSRIAVCGHAPVSTARTRAGSIRPERLDSLGVFLRDDVVGDDADLQIARLHHRDQALDQRRLAGADRTADADAGDTRQFGARPLSSQHVSLRQRQPLRRLAGRDLAVDIDVEGLRIDLDLRTGIVVQHVLLVELACAPRGGAASWRGRA